MERLGLLASSLLIMIALSSCSGNHSFIKKDSENLDLNKRIVEIIKKKGCDAWFLEPKEFFFG